MPAKTAPLRADLEHVVTGRNFRFPVFQNFEGAKVKLRENTAIYIRATHEQNIERIHFVSDISGWAGDGSGSVRVRVDFGWTNPLSTLAFYDEVAQNIGQFRIIKMF
jgi:hypothetical protein